MTTKGKVQDVTKEFEFEWRLDDFFSLPMEDGEVCWSPSFSFAGESWYLGLYPNGQSSVSSVGYIGLYLYRDTTGPPISLLFSLALKTFDGKKEQEVQFTHIFTEAKGYGRPKLLKRSSLLERKTELLPSDTLTIRFSVEHYSKSTDDVGNNEIAKCPHCKKSFDATYVPFHEQKCLEKPMKCPICADAVELRKWFVHECVKNRVKVTEKLIDDLGNIFGNEDHSDVTVKVKDEKFHLHRCILAGRNPFFSTMFKTEMKEKTTGIVTIDDCEPDTFCSFIHFIYNGKVNDMSLENVCDLYKVADKYQEDQLKEECLCFMKSNMTVESFYDFIILALMHEERELLEKATDLFCRKTKEITQTEKWETFVREYSTKAIDMYLKAIDYKPTK